MPQALLCPQCGKTVPADAPQGLCPACMMQVGLDSVASAFADRQTIAPQPPATAPDSPAPASAVTADEFATLPPNTPRAESVTEPASTGAPNADIPGYEILGELGRGGMGVVYKARHIKLNRVIALKMILAGGHAGSADLARFRTEAESIARLQHPNIVQVHEIGDHEGKPYFSLEFCAGGSLAQKIDGTPLPPKEAARMVETLARGMAAAHQKGIIHRDLRPANVLLLEDGTPKITDFGLARKLDDAGQTQSGAIMGTPSYMAPEQAGGRTKQLGPPADIYALGAILYELLTGRPPFKAATALDTVMQVVSDDPVPPRQLQSKTPRDLETICLKCLQKDPAKRYASAEALAEDLRRFQAGEPIQARPVGPVERAWRWCRRNPLAASLMVMVAATLVSGTAVSLYFMNDAYTNAAEALKQAAIAGDEKIRATLKANEAVAQTLLAEKEAKAARQAEQAALDREAEAKFQTRRANTARHAIQMDLAMRAWQERDIRRTEQILAEVLPAFQQNWETRYLATLSRRMAQVLTGNTWVATSVCFSPDGKTILTGGGFDTQFLPRSGELNLWDAQTGKHQRTLRADTGPVVSVCFSPDGQTILSGSVGNDFSGNLRPGELSLWDARTGKKKHTLAEKTQIISSICFSPDGKTILSGGRGHRDNQGRPCPGELTLWDAQTGQKKLTVEGNTQPVSSACFSPDGKTILSVSGGADNQGRPLPVEVKLWDAQTGQHQRTLQGHTQPVGSVCFSPDGKTILSGSEDATLKLWDAQTGQDKRTLKGHFGPVRCVCFSPDGETILSGGAGALKLWDPKTGQEKHSFKGLALAVCFSRDSKSFVSCGFDGTLMLWHTQPVNDRRTLTGHVTMFSGSVCFSPDSKMLFGRDTGGTLKLWDAVTGWEKLNLKKQDGGVFSVAFSPDGENLLSGGDGVLKLWDAKTGKDKRTLKGHNGGVMCVGFSPDGKTILSGSWDHAFDKYDKTLILWDALTGEIKHTFTGHKQPVTSICFSPDSKTIVSGHGAPFRLDKPGVIKMWNAVTGQEIRTLKGHSGGIRSVDFSPDGKTIVSGSFDKTLKLWDAETGQEKLTLQGHTYEVASVCYSPDGKTILSGSHDTTLKLWDAQTGQDRLTLKGPTGAVRHVCFSPDGKTILCGSADQTLHLWDAE